MRVSVCYNKGLERHIKPLNAFASGLSKNGYDVEKMYTFDFDTSYDPNFVVIFGSGSYERGLNARYKQLIIDWCKSKDIPYVMLEEAYIKRGEYWSVTVNGLSGHGYYLSDAMCSGRIDKITHFKPFSIKEGMILVCRQIERDANVGLTEKQYDDWFNKIMTELKYSRKPVKVREHPKKKPNQNSIEEDLRNSSYVVTYSSNSAVDAALHGIPFWVESDRSVVYDLRTKEDGPPSYEKQREVLNQVAHAQWTLNELEGSEGIFWDHFRRIKPIRYAKRN